MSFQPIVPFGGYAGWAFLNRTVDTQKAAFNESHSIKRATEVFREEIGSVETAEELVGNRALLSVALGAFGLDDDIDNKFFIRKILEEGTVDPESLANKLSDSRYAEFSKAFGFGSLEPTRTGFSFLADEIISRYEDRQFELAVGEKNNDLRLAMNLSSALDGVLQNNRTDSGRWFAMMGNAPLRNVFQTAFGFSSSFAAIDLDQQLSQFREKSKSIFGTSSIQDFSSEENKDKLIRLFLLRSEAGNISSSSPASTALILLS